MECINLIVVLGGSCTSLQGRRETTEVYTVTAVNVSKLGACGCACRVVCTGELCLATTRCTCTRCHGPYKASGGAVLRTVHCTL